MAVTLGTVTAFTSTGSSPISKTPTVDVGTTLLVFLVGARFNSGGTTGISGITVGGVSMTKIRTTYDGGQEPFEIWILYSPSTGTPTVSITHSASNPIFSGAFVPVLGTDTSGALRSQSGAVSYVETTGNPSGAASLSLTTASGDLCLGGIEFQSDTDITVTPNGTSQADQRTTAGANSGEVSVQTIAATGTSTTMSWALGASVENAAQAVVIVPSGGGGGGSSSATQTLSLLGVG